MGDIFRNHHQGSVLYHHPHFRHFLPLTLPVREHLGNTHDL